MANNFKPIIDALDKSVRIGKQLRVATLYKFLDLDDNPLTKLRISDLGGLSTSGYFTYRGKRLASGQTHEFNAKQISRLRYVAGLVPGQERFSVAGYDGKFWSDLDSATIRTANANRAPRVNLRSARGKSNEQIDIENIVQASDPDGAGIKRYRFKFNKGTGAYLVVRGKKVKGNRWITVGPNQFDDVYLQAKSFGKGNRGVRLFAQVYDGQDWSKIDVQRYAITPNRRKPTIKTHDVELETSQTTLVGNFFVEKDGDNNSFKWVKVIDTGVRAEGGYLTFKGEKLAARKWHTFAYNDLAKLKYQGSDTVDRERLRFRISDGRYWSKIQTSLVKTVSTPVVTGQDTVVMDDLDEVNLSSLISQQDAGPAVRLYRVYDGNTDNRSARMYDANGNRMAQGKVYTLTQAQFNQITIKGGKWEDRWHDEIMVRASNGQRWSDWERIDVFTEPNYLQALEDPTFGRWTPVLGQGRELRYTFLQTVPGYYAPDSDEWAGRATFEAFTKEQRVAARYALQQFADISNLTFREVPQDEQIGEITFGKGGWVDPFAYGYPPNFPFAGDVWLATGQPELENQTAVHEFLPFVLMHELGHAMGMSHTFFDHNPNYLPPPTENNVFSVMSYTAHEQNGGANPNYFSDMWGTTLSIYDIAKMQEYYGVNTNYNKLATVYKFQRNEDVVRAIWDAGGVDTINLSNQVRRQVVDLREGRLMSIGSMVNNVAIAFGAIIERAYGGQNNDSLTGNEVSNILYGNAGNDQLAGMGGADTLRGGAGDDVYFYSVGDGNDRIDEQNKGGNDRIQITVQEGLYRNYTKNALTDHFTFRRQGANLQINLTMNENESRGSIKIVKQGVSGFAVETLRLMYGDTKAETKDIDLNSIFVQATNKFQAFKLTDFQTNFGYVASPV